MCDAFLALFKTGVNSLFVGSKIAQLAQTAQIPSPNKRNKCDCYTQHDPEQYMNLFLFFVFLSSQRLTAGYNAHHIIRSLLAWDREQNADTKRIE
jgi:hypothetical protein